MDSKRMSQATTGIIVIVIGLIFLGHQLHFGLDIGRLWPLILIVLGISRFLVVDADGQRQNGNGMWLLLIGGLFLLNNYRVLGFGDSWPVLVIAAGVALVFGRDRDRRSRGPAPNPPNAGDSPNRVNNGSFQL